MNIYINVFLFLLCNAAGIMLAITAYAIAPIYKFINPETSDFLINSQFDMGFIVMAWATCLIFSISNFLLHGRWKTVFLIIPIIVPLLFTIATISKYI